MAAADLSNLSLNDDEDFEIISGADTPHSIYPASPNINASLVLHPMLMSTTTLLGQESIKDGQQSLGPAKERPFSVASSLSSDGISALLRAQEETLALTERQLQEYSIMQESMKASLLLQSKVDELTMEKEKLEGELEKTRAEADSLTERQLHESTRMMESMRTSSLLQSQMEEMSKKNEKLERELDESRARAAAMTEQLHDELSKMQEESVEASSQLQSRIREVLEKNAMLEKEIKEVRAKAAATTEKQQIDLSRMQKYMELRVDELSSKNENLEKELAESRNQANTITEMQSHYNSMMKELEQELSSRQSTIENQEKQLADQINKNSALAGKQQLDAAIIAKSKQESSHYQSRVNELSAKNEELERELADARAQTVAMIEKQHQELSKVQEESIEVSSQLHSRIREALAKNDELERELEATRGLLGSIERDVREEVNEELRKKDDTIYNLSEQVIILEEAKRANEEAKEQQLRRAPSLDEMEKMRADNVKQQKTITELNARLAEFHAINEANQRTVDKLLSKSDDASLQKNKVRELEAELTATKADSENDKAIISVLKDENEGGQRILAEQSRKIENMKRTLEKYGYFSDF